MHRRRFLQHSFTAAGAMAMAGRGMAAPAKPGVLNLCSQENRLPGGNLKEKVAYWKMAWNSQGTTTGIGSAFLGGAGAAQIRPHELVV